MRIALDAKRAFLNQTGLGNYSRAVIEGLLEFDSENEFFACTPKLSDQFQTNGNLNLIQPETTIAGHFPGLWRSKLIINQLIENRIDLYHGLSNELPFGIDKAGIKSVVTVHDLIFLRYPQFYSAIDRRIYEKKVRHACKVADRIIAISIQTKQDLVQLLNVDEKKIDVVYQSCHDRFSIQVSDAEKQRVSNTYGLPDKFILSVGTLEERKNHQQIIKALAQLSNSDVAVLIVGKDTSYRKELEKLSKRLGVDSRVRFEADVLHEDLPAIYQQAKMFVYTSLYEGFGIPVLEALRSGVPVIASKGGCLEEVGGSRSLYVNPTNEKELEEAMQRLLDDTELVNQMIEEGRRHAELFSQQKMVAGIQHSYTKAVEN